MLGIYFSGTGNTKYCVEKFVKECDANAQLCPIEDKNVISAIQNHSELVFGYPVQFSNLPKYVRDFINENSSLWKDKKIFIIATMGLFSGDGAGLSARLLKKYGAVIRGGLHLKMPDSISDEKALKRPLEENKRLVAAAGEKIAEAVTRYKKNCPTREGLGFFYYMAGLFGQRLYFYNKTKDYSNKLKIDQSKCVGCGTCAKICPMQNLHMNGNLPEADGHCTMCYRCISQCPAQAITLLGKQVVEQSRVERYVE